METKHLLVVSGIALIAVSFGAAALGVENWWWTSGVGITGGLLIIGAIAIYLISSFKLSAVI